MTSGDRTALSSTRPAADTAAMKAPRITYANVMSTLAVLIALTTGSAYAKATITGKQVKDGSLTGKDIKDRTIAARDLASRSVTGSLGLM